MRISAHKVDEPADTHTGLSGFIVITARDKALPNAKPKDVDREFFAFFQVSRSTWSRLAFLD